MCYFELCYSYEIMRVTNVGKINGKANTRYVFVIRWSKEDFRPLGIFGVISLRQKKKLCLVRNIILSTKRRCVSVIGGA